MTYEELHQRMLICLQQSSLFPTIYVRGFKMYLALIEALIEHRQLETHMFHFLSGEATITLEDVIYQFSVPLNGTPMVRQNIYDPATLDYQVLRKMSPSDNIEGYRRTRLFLRPEHILQLIGGVLLSDKYGNLAYTQYLQFLEDFVVCRNNNWGSMVLAFLYRKLCNVAIVQSCRKVDVAGCLILLQSRAWYRFPFLTAIAPTPVEFPLAAT
ncbi:protein MAIN-LIKE 2-like [Hibiscus syriacus]|uniref:protein MAIN-LIKE 2-like n=1 Tax=Hibiscus syriacus TaxID=106335 RepID=UPI001923DE1C|nr:protein MAIN-LIKE 2-like [Hibiscus syriacus]